MSHKTALRAASHLCRKSRLFKHTLSVFFLWMLILRYWGLYLLSIWKSLWEKLVYCTDWCVLNNPVFICKHLLNYKRRKLAVSFFYVLLLSLEGTFQLYFLNRKVCAQVNQSCDLWQDFLHTVLVRSSELQRTSHWEVFAFVIQHWRSLLHLY